MNRSTLLNQFVKTRSQQFKQAYNKQSNICVTMTRKAKQDYCNDVKVRRINDNKQFWKTLKVFFSNKVGADETITFIPNNKVVLDDKEVAATFKPYFDTIVENLRINR